MLYCISNFSSGFWVQSRKEDQILRLDLNSYWVIFKLLTSPRWLWDPGIFRFGILLEWVLGTVLRDDRDASLHLHVSRVVRYDPSGFWVLLLSFGFLLERLLPISMELAPAYVGVVFSLFILDCMVMYIYIIIVLFIMWLLHFIHLAFRTHVSSCVRDGIKHP
jgi:hypothetical protein